MNKTAVKEVLEIEQVVQPDPTLDGLQAPGGTFVSREELGAGVIREIAHEPIFPPLDAKPPEEEEILVHWVSADFDTWAGSLWRCSKTGHWDSLR